MYDVPLVGGPVAVRGAAELEPTPDGLRVHRLPAAARARLPDDFIRMCELQPAGVRLTLRTAATRLELDVRALRTVSVNRPPDGSDGPLPDAGRYDVVVDGEVVGSSGADAHGTFRLDHAIRRARVSGAPVATVRGSHHPGRVAGRRTGLRRAARLRAALGPSRQLDQPRGERRLAHRHL